MKEKSHIYGILGSGISYTLSPAIFSLLFRKFKLNDGYFVFDCEKKNLKRFVDSAKLLGVSGFNVTMPFKNSIIRHLNSLDRESDTCQSVNLVISRRNGLKGYNTDIFGIDSVFRDSGITSFSQKRILVIGAGGTGRTALTYFQKKKATDITVINRNRKRLELMLNDLGVTMGSRKLHSFHAACIKTSLEDFRWDVILNATPVPTEKIVSSKEIDSGTYIFEAAYSFSNRQSVRSLTIHGGYDMLIYQALRSFEIMTGERVGDYSKMKRSIRRKLLTK